MHRSVEQELWRAVIAQSLADAMNKSNRQDRHEARIWFITDGNDFRLVCDLAGEDHVRVRRKALRMIDEADDALSKPNEREEKLAPLLPELTFGCS